MIEGATPVPAWVARHARSRPDAPAVTTIGEAGVRATTTWAELASRMDRAAATLGAHGVRPGDRVAALASNRIEFYDAYLGAARIGAIFVPLNRRNTARELATILTDARPGVVVVEVDLRELLSGVSPLDAEVLAAETLTRDGTGPLPPAPDVDDPVAILYTSGTTGRPKGALFTHRAFWSTGVNQTAALGLDASDRHLVVSPLAFTGGILTSTQPALFSGGEILLEASFEPTRLLARMRDESPTVFMAVPAMLQLLLDHPDFDAAPFASLRYLGSGSAPVPRPLFERYRSLGISIGHAYGLTEGGGLATQLPPADAAEHPGAAGCACPLVELRIVDAETGLPVPPGVVGEIHQRGPSVMRGYWNDPAATATAFDGDWLRTGDLGSIDGDGYLSIAGRLKDVVITGGMNVYPAEVESAIAEMPGVADVAVIGVPHETFGETVVAVIAPREGAELSLDIVREHLRPLLADYKLPRGLRLVAELPRTSSGKIRKADLRTAAEP